MQNEHYHSTFQLEEKEQRIKFTDHLEIHVLELPKVKWGSNLADKNALEKWLLFISGDDRTKEELAVSDMGIERAYNELQRISEDEVMQERAIAREKYLSDQATRRELAIEKGKEEGKAEIRTAAILAMYSDGLPVEMIAKYMGVSVEQVNIIIFPIQ